MKLLFCSMMIAATVNSCNDPNIRHQIARDYEDVRSRCLDVGGVPVVDYIYDSGTTESLPHVTRCDLPKPEAR